jgi:tripartite motif-containing protein 71
MVPGVEPTQLQLNGPQGDAIDSQNNLWVADTGNNRIEEFNEKGEYVSKFGSEGTGNGQFKGPRGPAIAPNGSIWVADAGNARIEKCSTTGECASYGQGHVFEATDLAVAPNGNVWVADPREGRVEEFNEKGEFIRQVGSLGDATALTVDGQGNVWVSDYAGNRVVELSGETGGTISQFGKSGTGNGTLNGPVWISADANGDLWVVDDYNSARVQEFTPSGEYITHFGGGFYYPSGLTVNSGFAYLELGNAVQKWSLVE